MKYLDFKRLFDPFPLVSLNEIRKVEPYFDSRRLHEWQEKGYLQKVSVGKYIFTESGSDDLQLFAIANKLYSPSYVSLESALSFHNVIPEAVYVITSVGSKKTQRFDTPLGWFSYRHLKSTLMFGFTLQRLRGGMYCKIAELEKALLDYFYLNPHSDVKGLRINRQILTENLNREKLQDYLCMFENSSLEKRITEVIN